MNAARGILAGTGTQTAALGFGGDGLLHLFLLQEQQKNTMEINLDNFSCKFEYSKRLFSRLQEHRH
jgi:hypothetical protein